MVRVKLMRKSVTELEERYRDGGVAIRASVRSNIRQICKDYFNWDLEEFHLEALQAMFEGGYLILNWPTDHAKSTMGCFLFPLLSLMENPDETHIICGANINDSKRRVQALQREIETNKYLIQDFPWLAKPEGKEGRIWSATQFNVTGRTINKPNPSVLAAAVGSSDVKGRRGKLMMDDIEGEEARWSPLKRQQLYSWVTLEADRCYEDRNESSRPLLCLMGTPFDVDSIYFAMERHDWRVMRRPAYNPDGSYLWPAKKAKVEEKRRRLRKREFSVAYLMDPTGGDPSKVSAMQLARATQEAEFEHDLSLGLVSIDPASGGQTRQSDYAGVVVVRVHWESGEPLPDVEMVECHSVTEGLFEQVHMLAALSAQYGYPVLYETNSQQGNVYRNTFLHLHPETQLLRHYTSAQSKFDDNMGLTVVKRIILNKRLKVPPHMLEEEGVTQFITEVRDLAPPFNQHNHISAAVWFAVRYAYEQVRYRLLPGRQNSYGTQDKEWYLRYNGGRPRAIDAYKRFGYRPWNYTEDVVQKAMREEEERFREALTKRRA